MTVPLYACTGKNRFHWGEEQQPAFDEVKLALASAPVLTLPIRKTTSFWTRMHLSLLLEQNCLKSKLGWRGP